MPERLVARRPVVRLREASRSRTIDSLIVEEPMELRVDGQTVSVTMRTPGNDFDLALGLCLTEGLVSDPQDVLTIRYCEDGTGAGEHNVVDVHRRSPGAVPARQRRSLVTSTSCGLCGSASIDAVRRHLPGVGDDPVTVDPLVLAGLPDTLRAAQRLFERTGGLHAAGLFTPEGELRCLREDAGRHNAVDKVIGWAAAERLLPLTGHVLLVSGRVAFEIAQKALYARLPVLAAVSAPSSLAVDLAEASGMTVIGFLRGASMNLYSHPHRVSA